MPLNFTLEKNLHRRGYRFVAGVDEVGRGAWAGPLVAAAVVFPLEEKIPNGLNDSKLLTPRRRQSLAAAIISAAESFSLAMVSPEEIDARGISWATQKVFAAAIGGLNCRADFVLTDAYRINSFSPTKQRALIRGDRQVSSIAAASILAKVYRDWLMSNFFHFRYSVYNFRQHKGYGTPEHRALIIQNGLCPIHRRSFLQGLTGYAGTL